MQCRLHLVIFLSKAKSSNDFISSLGRFEALIDCGRCRLVICFCSILLSNKESTSSFSFSNKDKTSFSAFSAFNATILLSCNKIFSVAATVEFFLKGVLNGLNGLTSTFFGEGRSSISLNLPKPSSDLYT
eukprot:NODE_638_length_5124_cov_1.416119.p6 type:complete len:130 gc:universal NODE_638_length_5124_cov_1.416119:508-119(-)